MKRSHLEADNLLSPPISPNKTPNHGQNHVSELIIPYSKAHTVDNSIKSLLNALSSFDNDMRDDFIVDRPGKILIFLDAQGKQFIKELDHQLNFQFKMPVIFISSGSINPVDQHHNQHDQHDQHPIIYASNDDCVKLSKYFSVLDPLGGGIYPLNRLLLVSDNLVRVNIPLKLNYNNPFEKFGLLLNELAGILQEIIPYLY